MSEYQYSYKFSQCRSTCPCGHSESFSELERDDDGEYLTDQYEEQAEYGYCPDCREFFKPTPEDKEYYLHKNW